MPQVKQFAESTVTYDDRYLPLIILIWEGRANLESAQWGMARQVEGADRMVARAQKFVSISDATHAQRPEPAVRKYWADTFKQTNPAHQAATLATHVIIASPLMRGVLTAIGWLSEEARNITTFPSMAESIREALELLDSAGIPHPEGLTPENYRPPSAGDQTRDSA